MTVNIEDLPGPLQFAYIAMTRTAIYFKDMDHDKIFFLSFCDEIWESMEMTDLQYLKDALEGKMKKDLQPLVESYVKSQEGPKENSEK